MRSMTSAVETELQAQTLSPAILGEFLFDSGVVRLWTGYRDLSYSGNIFFGGGPFLRVSVATETLELRASGIDVSLSGIPNSLLSIALAEDYQGREATLWLAVFDASNVLINNPVVLIKGEMDVMNIDYGGETSTITLSIENELIRLQRTAERLYNDAEQQFDYPGDLGFEFTTRLFDGQTLEWGI